MDRCTRPKLERGFLSVSRSGSARHRSAFKGNIDACWKSSQRTNTTGQRRTRKRVSFTGKTPGQNPGTLEEIFRCSRHEVPLPRAGWTGDRWFFVDFRHSRRLEEAEVKSEISRPGHDSAMACAHPFAFQSPPKETSPAAYVPPLLSSSSSFFSLIRPRLPSRTLLATWADAQLFRHCLDWKIVRFSNAAALGLRNRVLINLVLGACNGGGESDV